MELEKKFIKWYFTKGCDLGCTFCHNAYTRNQWEHDCSDDFLRRIAYNLRNSNRIQGLTFLGGEPTYNSNLVEVCNILNGASFRFGIVTAGHKLKEEKYEQVLLNPNLGFIGFSIDSLDKELVKSIRKRDILNDQLDSLLKVLEYRKQHNKNYEVYINTILTKENSKDICNIIDFFVGIGINKIKLLSYNVRDKGQKGAANLKLEQEELFEISKTIAFHAIVNKQLWHEQNFELELNFLSSLAKEYFNKAHGFDLNVRGHLCPISRSTVFVKNDGGLYACEDLKPYFGIDENNIIGFPHKVRNLAEEQFDEIVDSLYLATTFYTVGNPSLYENMKPCNSCHHLFKNCVPCGLPGTNKDNEMTNQHCSFYKEKLDSEGIITSVDKIERLWQPIKKHKIAKS